MKVETLYSVNIRDLLVYPGQNNQRTTSGAILC